MCVTTVMQPVDQIVLFPRCRDSCDIFFILLHPCMRFSSGKNSLGRANNSSKYKIF